MIHRYIVSKQKYKTINGISGGGLSDGHSQLNVLECKKCMVFDNGMFCTKNLYDDEELTKGSEFLIGSLTKIFTIIALLILHDQKVIDVNNKWSVYHDHPELKDTKIIDVMGHKAGIKRNYVAHDNNVGPETPYLDARSVYKQYKDQKIITETPGQYKYSNLGFMMLGVLIEKVTKKTYGQNIEQLIARPLEMKDTGIQDIKNLTLYRIDETKINHRSYNERTFAGAAGQLKSTVNDMIRFAGFPGLLSDESKGIITTLYVLGPPPLPEYELVKGESGYVVWHHGGIHGSKVRLRIKYSEKWDDPDIWISFKTLVN